MGDRRVFENGSKMTLSLIEVEFPPCEGPYDQLEISTELIPHLMPISLVTVI